MLLHDGDYVWKFWQIGFDEGDGKRSSLEVAAVIRQPKGSAQWRVRGRVRVRHDELCPDGSRDVKWWFESPAFETKEEAYDAWSMRLDGFMEESELTIGRQTEILLDSSSEQEIMDRLVEEGVAKRAGRPHENAAEMPGPKQGAVLLN